MAERDSGKGCGAQRRYLGMFKDKVEIGLDEELIKRLEQGRKRAFTPQGEQGPVLEANIG